MTPAQALASVLMGAGGVFCIVGAVGMLRMPDFFTRMHAASVIETLGAGLVIAGLVVLGGFTLESAKLLALLLLIFFTSPTATHALARAAHERGVEAVLDPAGPPEGERAP